MTRSAITPRPLDAQAVADLRTNLIGIARRIDRQVSVPGFTQTEARAMSAIATRGPLSLQELAVLEGIHPTMLSRVIRKLELGEYIRRQTNTADRRTAKVIATRKGTRLRDRLFAERAKLLAERLGELPAESVEQIFAANYALEQLVAALEPR
ncbi:MAG: hypothetical protein JWM76_2792 [Pseudonocardiales bacterium]|nr:hypothetical protein [Pseudonocardiales bacterium]